MPDRQILAEFEKLYAAKKTDEQLARPSRSDTKPSNEVVESCEAEDYRDVLKKH